MFRRLQNMYVHAVFDGDSIQRFERRITGTSSPPGNVPNRWMTPTQRTYATTHADATEKSTSIHVSTTGKQSMHRSIQDTAAMGFFSPLDSLCVRCACSIIFLLPDRWINWFDLIDQWIVLFREFVFLLFCRNWSDGAYVLALLRNALCAAKFAVLLFRQFIQHLNKLSSCSYVKRAQKKLQNHCLPQNDQIHD